MYNKEAFVRYQKALNVDYAYNFAKHMEQERTNPVLGYRSAGSKAELATGDLILSEMKKIGLSDAHKDVIMVDSWEFHHATLAYTDRSGIKHFFQLGAYQTDFKTDGPQSFQLVYAKNGTALDYEDIDVRGKIVLVDINQRNGWWINFPVYQAHLRGAAALIAVQTGGYGEIDETALNAQDIAGPANAPAFSISKRDAVVLKADLLDVEDVDEITVTLDADTQVTKNKETFNICGVLPGKTQERIILLSAHYDSYFNGFQDDNTAIAMMLGIARALIISGYEPVNTIVFCAMASEEWGVIDSKYDWSTGAYEEVARVHPEWAGKAICDMNFELVACKHGTKGALRCTYEYEAFMKNFIKHVPFMREVYPEGAEVMSPVETWSDDFSMAISGIPSMVNDFSDGSFMETHYHSQFDNDTFYDEHMYNFHHKFYGMLVMEIDSLKISPLDFSVLYSHAYDSIDEKLCAETGADGEKLLKLFDEMSEISSDITMQINKLNSYKYAFEGSTGSTGSADASIIRSKKAIKSKKTAKAGKAAVKVVKVPKKTLKAAKILNAKQQQNILKVEKILLSVFKDAMDTFVRLNWKDEVIFPHQAVENNIEHLKEAKEELESGNITEALHAIYLIDNNQYAFLFDADVYAHFTEYVLKQPADRLKWGTGRIVHHENLYDLVSGLMRKLRGLDKRKGYRSEIEFLNEAIERQKAFYQDDIAYMIRNCKEMKEKLLKARLYISKDI